MLGLAAYEDALLRALEDQEIENEMLQDFMDYSGIDDADEGARRYAEYCTEQVGNTHV